jgi:hypothetical protein
MAGLTLKQVYQKGQTSKQANSESAILWWLISNQQIVPPSYQSLQRFGVLL